MEMARYILKILMADPIVLFSWGFHDVKTMKNGLRFTVNGYLHSGDVEITYEEGSDSFKVRTFREDNTVKQEKSGIYISELTDTIDRMVELCDDYADKVLNDYLFDNS